MPLDVRLAEIGWHKDDQVAWGETARGDQIPARVVGLHRNHIVDLLTVDGELAGRPAGRMLQDRSSSTAMPAVGDWVAALPDGTIQEILPRRSTLARRSAADRDRIQILATNIDKAIVISSLNREHDPVRLDRMVRLAEASGAEPVIGLSKSDLTDEAHELKRRVQEAFPSVKVFVFSSRTGEGVEAVREFLAPGETVVMLGRSGVGKSTLANTLLGWDRQKTAEIRGTDDRGRHATTSRELFPIPGGALLIDTPGLRAPGSIEADDLIPGSAESDLTDERAREIERLAAYCRFRDCAHETEPDCAVNAAIEAGELPAR
ncbi:MAG: ribosome small subunit-dependent GTPase A [Solirubrobacterales bacterium]|nr:ribosome small subunit-dependent GTPase A [Solirubrobacterales bacterium]